MNNVIRFGTIVNTFGTKGYLKVVLDSNIEFKNDISLLEIVFYKTKTGSLIPMRLQNIELKDGNLLIKIKDLDNINDVIKFKNHDLYVFDEQDIFIEKISFLDLKVEFENKTGYVVDTMNNGLQDLVKIKMDDYNKEFWVPVVDNFVDEIDEQKMIIKLKNIEGLK